MIGNDSTIKLRSIKPAIHIFMGISTLYSIHRLGMVKEVGEVEEKIVVHEFVSEVRRRMLDVSAVGGLRQMVNFPFLVAKQLSGLMPPNLGVRQGEMKGMAQQRR